MPGQNPVTTTQGNQQANQAQAEQYLKGSLATALAGEKALPMDPAMKWTLGNAPGGSLMKGGPKLGSFSPTTGEPPKNVERADNRSLASTLGKFDAGLTGKRG